MKPLLSRRSGLALDGIVVIAVFLAVIAALGARAAARSAEGWSLGLSGALTVQLIAPDTPQALEAAAKSLRKAPGVVEARAVTPQRALELLRDWAGPNVKPGDLPELRLIELELEKGFVSPDYARALKNALSGAGYEAEVYGPGPWAETAAQTARRFRAMSAVLAIALIVTMVVVVGLAGRAFVRGLAPQIALLADLGAKRGQAANGATSRAALRGLMAGLIGAVAAAALAAYLLQASQPHLRLRDLMLAVGPPDLAPLLAAPIVAALICAAGARTSVHRMFNAAARIR